MPSYVIDPAKETVTPVEIEGDFLDAVRREIGAVQLAVIPVADGRFAVWCNAMGMITPGRCFWRFSDSEHRFAGTCLVTGLGPDGMPIPFPEKATPEDIREGLVFHPSEDLERIVERVAIVANDEGRPVPIIVRDVIWRDAEPEPESVPGEAAGWTVFEREAGGYRAIQYELRDEALEAAQMLSAPSLEALRAKLPAGLARHEPTDVDAPEVVEHWL